MHKGTDKHKIYNYILADKHYNGKELTLYLIKNVDNILYQSFDLLFPIREEIQMLHSELYQFAFQTYIFKLKYIVEEQQINFTNSKIRMQIL